MSNISSELISQFVKATKDDTKQKKESIVYGIVETEDAGNGLTNYYIKIVDDTNQLQPITKVRTPVTTTVHIDNGDVVSCIIKNHTAIVTGNITSPAAKNSSLVTESIKVNDLQAVNANIIDTLTTQEAKIGTLEADYGNFKTLTSDRLEAAEATIGELETDSVSAEHIAATYATIVNLNATNANIQTLSADYGDFKTLTSNIFSSINADIQTLQVNKLSAVDIEGLYANIDFSNISVATIGSLFASSGILDNVVINNSKVTGELTGVTISGDLINANTLVANKLILQGDDGLYYKLNTDGIKVEAQQTNKNSLDGSIITAKSVTASKITVSDLVAFGATIGGFNITNSSLYSGSKASAVNTTRGIFLGNDGQISFGDATNYFKYINDNGIYKLQISADSILFGVNKTSIDNALSTAKSEAISTALADATTKANTARTEASKVATNFMNLTASDGLVIGDRTVGTLAGNVQIKAETGGASISLRNGTTNLAKFIATSKAYSGVTTATTTTSSTTESDEDDNGTTTQTVTAASQTVVNNQTKSVVRFDSSNPIYFSSGLSTDGVLINSNGIIANSDFTLNGRMFDRIGRSSFETITEEGNLSIGYGRFRNATASSSDSTIVYGNKVKLATKKGASITQDGATALDTKNSSGNMTLGYHLYKTGTGNLNIYAGDTINLRSDTVDIRDSTGNTCFEAKNSSNNTVIGYSRYANGGNTNIYAGSELNLQCTSGGNIIANNSIFPSSNASLALGKFGEKGWSNIYIGNNSGVYNGLRMIVDGVNENLCGRDSEGRYIFGNNGSIMNMVVKDVGPSSTGTSFRVTSGNHTAGNNTSSVWLFGSADGTSRYIGSYLTYARTYTASANMNITSNGVFGRSTSSSQRYKRDISIANLSDLSGLYNLPVKKFKYNNDYICCDDELYDKYMYGFMVEDLVDILPCAVEHIENPEDSDNPLPEMWNANIIIPAMMKLIQDLNNRLIALENN